MSGKKINIAVAGGPGTGKSTLAAYLFASLKMKGYDYDFIGEEKRKLEKEFGNFRTAFERFYIWRQQEREELRSYASNGFVTDAPLFYLYINAKMYASEERDKLAIRELFRMCLDLEDRYQLIVMAKNPAEIDYRTDYTITCGEQEVFRRHKSQKSFVEHFWPEKLLFVEGVPQERLAQVETKFNEIRRQIS